MALLLTGYIAQSLSLCELRGKLEAERPAKPLSSAVTSARRLLEIYNGVCGLRYCARRLRLEGEIGGLAIVASPDLVLFTREERPIAVVKATLSRSPKPLRIYSARLLVEAYVVSSTYGGDPVLAVLQASSPEKLIEGARYMIDAWSPAPYRGDGFSVHTRLYDKNEAERILRRALEVLTGLAQPRPRPGPACRFCPFRDECPHAAKDLLGKG